MLGTGLTQRQFFGVAIMIIVLPMAVNWVLPAKAA